MVQDVYWERKAILDKNIAQKCARDANDAIDNDTNDAKELSYSRC